MVFEHNNMFTTYVNMIKLDINLRLLVETPSLDRFILVVTTL